jgi:AsmA family protein
MGPGARRTLFIGRPRWLQVLALLVASILAVALVVALFPWDVLRGPLNRFVSERTGRDFAVTRKLDVKVGPTTRILADGIEFANPNWAQDKHLVKAESAEVRIRLWPWLAQRRLELPLVVLRKPQLGLQLEPDGRRSWALGRDTRDAGNVPHIGALVIDHGSLHFVATGQGADIRSEFSIDGPMAGPHVEEQALQALPLRFSARGTWQDQPFRADGRTGNVLYLSSPGREPFPIEVNAAAGATRLMARGAVASLRTLDGARADVDLQGRNLADLYKLLGVVLPETPSYSVRGHVSKSGEVWQVRNLAGRLGNSDLSGELSLDRERDVPQLAGHLMSKWLDFNDLAPLVGMEDKPRGPAAESRQSFSGAKAARPPRDPGRKVLPQTALDLARLKAMNADVSYTAARVTNVRQFPLERVAVRARLKDGVLRLDPMNLGMAGGTLTGRLRIDSHAKPAVGEAHLNARSMELNKLMRNEQLIKSSFGKIHGDFDLSGRGNSAAQILGSASGSVSLLMGPGQISNLLLELAGLDGGEILKFLLGGDRNVPVRCAATAFDVSKGVMTSRAVVLDTADTVIWGDGHVNFASEALDLYFRPYPKDASILSLRAPIKVQGTLGAPQAGPDKSALGGRAGLAVALGAINPLLALAATIETGPGKDANCGEVLRRAASPDVGLDGKSLSDRERARQPADPARGASPNTRPQAPGASPQAPGASSNPQGQ